MSNQLLIGNLPLNASEDSLEELFSEAGQVRSVSLTIDKATGKNKGFAFVEMSTAKEARQAVDMFNGLEIDGRRLNVNISGAAEKDPVSFFAKFRKLLHA